MDLYDLTTYTPHILMVLSGFALVTMIYFGGMLNLSLEIDQAQENDFQKAIVLENTLSIEASFDELKVAGKGYSYDRRRAYIPVEFFTREEDDGVGYSKKNGHCYIKRSSGLDGEHFGFYIKPLESTGSTNLDCTGSTNRRSAVYSPALLVRKASDQPLLPVRLYIYEIN